MRSPPASVTRRRTTSSSPTSRRSTTRRWRRSTIRGYLAGARRRGGPGRRVARSRHVRRARLACARRASRPAPRSQAAMAAAVGRGRGGVRRRPAAGSPRIGHARGRASACSTTSPWRWPACARAALAQRIADRRLGRASRRRHAGDLRCRCRPVLRVHAPVAALPRHRRARRSAASGRRRARSTTGPCRRAPATTRSSKPGTRDLLPAVEAFAPDAILVSAGFDAHVADPLASLRVTEEGYARVARIARRAELAARAAAAWH